MDREFKYDAFISYRHTDLDKYVAENLHKVLETYELPKNLKEKLGINGRTIKRVFRDQDELPLSSNLEDPIVDALNQSKYLIVICSPRLKESLWCRKEIETFKKIRGRKNIFCVLIEGEPEDSFPEEVLFEEKIVTDKNGKKKKEKEYFEPLAADVRGIDKKDILKKIKQEKLRLVAPMYNLDYDDLKQRHRQRRIKRIITTSIIASFAFFLIALYSVLTLLKISSQQKILKLHQAQALVTESKSYLKKDSKYKAVNSAYSALTKFKGVKMPYTADAEYALAESLGVYNAGVSYKSTNELNTKGVVDFVKVSSDEKYALTIDEAEEITLWDLKKVKKIKSFSDISTFTLSEEDFAFIGVDKFAYINKKGDVKVVSTRNGKVLHTFNKENITISLSSDEKGKYIAINNENTLSLYSSDKYELLGEYKLEGKLEFAEQMQFTLDGTNLVAFASKENLDIENSVKSTVYVFNTKDLDLKDSFVVDAEYFENIIDYNGVIYILGNRTVSFKTSMLLLAYDYKNNKVNYTKIYPDGWGKIITRTSYKEANNLALVHGNVVDILNPSNGDISQSFTVSSDVIGIFTSTISDVYLVFTSDGTANFLNLKERENFKYPGLFELNLSTYTDVEHAGDAYLLIPKYENRVVLYEQNSNKKIKEVKNKYEIVSDQGISLLDYDKLKKKYNIKKKNLVKKMLYVDNKKYLVISYSDKSAAIYNAKTKEFINMVDNVADLYYDFGKDNGGRIYIGNVTDAYVFDKDFNKVAHIMSMINLDKKNNKVIISHNGSYYSLPIYNYDELLKEAKVYLNK